MFGVIEFNLQLLVCQSFIKPFTGNELCFGLCLASHAAVLRAASKPEEIMHGRLVFALLRIIFGNGWIHYPFCWCLTISVICPSSTGVHHRHPGLLYCNSFSLWTRNEEIDSMLPRVCSGFTVYFLRTREKTLSQISLS